MRIGIVLHPYGEDKPAGLGRAIFEITRSLIELDRDNEYLVILRKPPKTLPQFAGSNWKIKIADYKYFWLDRALLGEKLDICIFNTPIVSFFVRPKKTIVIAYDFAYDDFGGNRLVKAYNKFSLKAADIVISISDATKKEAVKLFGIPEGKIKTVYLGLNKVYEGDAKKPAEVADRFFFFVGAIKERKNVLGIVRAFHQAKIEGLDFKLIISGNGKGEYFESIKNYIRENHLDNEVIMLGHTTNEELLYLYKNARALIYPSFIEGFGFPILEAMAHDLPVITSNSSSLPEVAGDAAILVNPSNIEEIKNAILNLASNESLREELIQKGRKQIKKFSWGRNAREILVLIKEIGYSL